MKYYKEFHNGTLKYEGRDIPEYKIGVTEISHTLTVEVKVYGCCKKCNKIVLYAEIVAYNYKCENCAMTYLPGINHVSGPKVFSTDSQRRVSNVNKHA